MSNLSQPEHIEIDINLQYKELTTTKADLAVAINELKVQRLNKKKRAAELVIANVELAYQVQEKADRESELLVAKGKLSVQKKEKRKRAAALILANKELIYQTKEKGKRAAELVIANIELLYQHDEKEKRAKELIIANRKLNLQYEYVKSCAGNLKKVNRQLLIQNTKNAVQSKILLTINKDLFAAKEQQKQHILVLEKMMFHTSHKLRKPVVQLLALSTLLLHEPDTTDTAKELISLIKQATESLDVYTRQLTSLINGQKLNNKAG